MTPLTALLGARIRRVDSAHAGLLTLVLSGRKPPLVLLVSFGPHARGVGLIEARPAGAAAAGFVQRLRKELEGARLCGFEQMAPDAIALQLSRGPASKRLVCNFGSCQLVLEDDKGNAVIVHSASSTPERARQSQLEWPASVEELCERGAQLLRDSVGLALEERRAQLAKLLLDAQRKLRRRLTALRGDIERAGEASTLRTRGNLVLANLSTIKRGATSVRLLDYSLDPPENVEIALDPGRETREQVEHWFKQARRFDRGAQLASARSETTQRELQQLAALSNALTSASAAALEDIANEARKLGVRASALEPPTRTRTRALPPRRKPYREFRGHAERRILVGKGAEDNDTLTREHARPFDLWLHARDLAGAHVVVPLDRHEVCPQELLLDAAHLAAHFSDGRNQAIVDVSYTPKRYVRKPRHAPKGLVQLDREKVIALHVDRKRLARLLTRELQL